MEGVLNLSAFGDIIENPRKKARKEMELELPVKQAVPSMGNQPETGFTFDQFRKNSSDSLPIQPVATAKQNTIACKLLKNTAQEKLFQWQTCSYSEHKTLDKFLDNFLKLSDTLMESIMGKYGRPQLTVEDSTLQMVNYDSQDISHFMDSLYECYSCEVKEFFDPKKDSELINTLDEILALIDKTKYLLTLK
jgi:hypothetical protein